MIGGTTLLGSLAFAGFKMYRKRQERAKGEKGKGKGEEEKDKVVEIGSGAGIKTEEVMQVAEDHK